MVRCVTAALLLAGAVFADEVAERDKLIGKWQQEDESWALETHGDALHVTHSVKQKTDEYECTIMGRDCEVKVAGRPAKVSLWFNGGSLVEMETRGKDVVKRRFHAGGDGDTLLLDVIPINPEGKTETVTFKRVPVSTARK
jgi:hypothetical protein